MINSKNKCTINMQCIYNILFRFKIVLISSSYAVAFASSSISHSPLNLLSFHFVIDILSILLCILFLVVFVVFTECFDVTIHIVYIYISVYIYIVCI